MRKLESYIEQIAVEVQARASALERERQERESLAHTYAGLQVKGGMGGEPGPHLCRAAGEGGGGGRAWPTPMQGCR